jgi:hypothetical protein
LQRLIQPRNRFDVANRTEQTHDDIERVPEFKVDHVRMMKDDPWIALMGDCQHLLIQIKRFDNVVLLQKGDMPSSTTGNIK